MEPLGQWQMCPAKNTTAFRWNTWWQGRNAGGVRIAVGGKEMLFLPSIFTHHFCRWKDLQNLLSIAVQESQGKHQIRLCFVKVSLCSTMIDFSILWKAKIWDSAVAFVEAFSISWPLTLWQLSWGKVSRLFWSPPLRCNLVWQGREHCHPSDFHGMDSAGMLRLKQTDLPPRIAFQRSD